MLFNLEKLDRCKNIILSSISYLLNLHLVNSDILTKIINFLALKFCCCCSVTQSCPTLHTPGLPVPYHLPASAQVHVHCIMDMVHLILLCPLLLLPSIVPSVRDFSNESAVPIGDQNTGALALASVLLMSIQD